MSNSEQNLGWSIPEADRVPKQNSGKFVSIADSKLGAVSDDNSRGFSRDSNYSRGGDNYSRDNNYQQRDNNYQPRGDRAPRDNYSRGGDNYSRDGNYQQRDNNYSRGGDDRRGGYQGRDNYQPRDQQRDNYQGRDNYQQRDQGRDNYQQRDGGRFQQRDNYQPRDQSRDGGYPPRGDYNQSRDNYQPRDGYQQKRYDDRRGGRPDSAPSNCLIVFGLPPTMTTPDFSDFLRAVLKDFRGRFDQNIVEDRETRRCKGYGFVSLDSIEEATIVKEILLTQGSIDGQVVRVDFSKPRPERNDNYQRNY